MKNKTQRKFNFFLISILYLSSFYPTSSFSQIRITKEESRQSLFIEILKGNAILGSATGFVIKSKSQNYLVTNYHVVTNKDASTGKWLDTALSPDNLIISYNTSSTHVLKRENLYDKNGLKRWHSNTIGNENVDVIELPLIDTNGIKIYPVNYNLVLPDQFILSPTDRLFVVGYPEAISSNEFPLFKSGTIASEPDIDPGGRPLIWLDIYGIGGTSGSPVFFIGNQLRGVDGTLYAESSFPDYFMGVFASGITPVYGALWKAKYLKPIFDALP